LILRRSIRTANFLQINAARPFQWGEWDCNLFIADLLDHIDSDMPWRSLAIRGKYDSRLGACRFQHRYTSAPEWLEQQGYRLGETDQFQPHDIILEPKKRFWAASLYFAGHTWSVIEDRALMMNVVNPGKHTVARFCHG
jgi:hypothetical protein